MSAKLRSVKPRPLKGSCIRNILANNPHIADQIEEKIEDPIEFVKQAEPTAVKAAEAVTLHSEEEYDSLHPEEELRRIVAFLKNVKERYESNRLLVEQCQSETVDLWHYAEMHRNLNLADGFAFYKKTRDTCRKRRICKNEMELLQPLVNYLANHPEILNDLPQIQGACGKAKEKISLRTYTPRTDVIA